MNRAEAQRERDRMAEEHPDSTWLTAEQEPGEWSVVKVGLKPAAVDRGEAVESRPRPPQPNDTRSSHSRNVGGEYA